MNDPNYSRVQQLIYKLNFDMTEDHVRASLLDLVNYHTGATEVVVEYLLMLQARAGIQPMPPMQPVVQQGGQMGYVPQQHPPQQYATPPQGYVPPMPMAQAPVPPQSYPPPAPQAAPDQPYTGQPTSLNNPIVGGGPGGKDDSGNSLGAGINQQALQRTEFKDGVLQPDGSVLPHQPPTAPQGGPPVNPQ